jgi:amino acid adenylation domain-containing protein
MTAEPIDHVTALPASSGQERLWFADQLTPGSPLYNVHLGTALRGPVDPAALAAALSTVVARHEALRTVLRAIDGRPRQIVADRLDVPTRVHDLTGVRPEDRVALTARRAAQHARAPFDLATGPLLRSDLLRFDATDHAWLLTLHHAVCDGWSVGILFDEVSRAYAAHLAGRTPAFGPLPLQYADYAVWQRETLDGGDLDPQLAYWRDRMAGAPPLLALPTDRSRPPAQRHAGALVETTLPAPVSAAVHGLARRERVTPFMTLLAAFGAALNRLTGARDLVVGTAVDGRGRVELEPLVGFFTNTVPLRLAVDPASSLREMLGAVRECVVDAQSHADLPFERLVEALVPRRDPSYHPLFQLMFDVQPGGHSALRLPGVTVVPLRVLDRRISLFDFSVSVELDPAGIRLTAEYATDLFSREAATVLLDAYVAVLTAAVADPDRPLGTVPLLDPDRRAAVLAAGDRRAAAAVPETLPALLAAAARDRPDAVAVHDAGTGRRYDYRALHRWSGTVAAHLYDAGIGRGDVVALLTRRGPAAIAGLLGVLRAGAAYLPIDPESPPGRIADLLADACPAAVLTDPALRDRLPSDGPPPLHLAAEPPPFRPFTDGPLDPDDLAYVMYTSGSTGRPKGVLVPHRGVANYARADAALYRLTADDRVLQFTSLAFDVSAEEIFPCLAAGARLVLRGDGMIDTAADFLAECGRLGVTVTHLPTAYFHELVDAGGRPPPSLRVIAIGGEPTTVARVAAWRALAPDVLLANAYGPTETSIAATVGRLAGPGAPARLDRVPIGGPVDGDAVRVLDDELEPVPPGVVGAVYIGGAGLARGYLGRPDLTASRFVPDPFTPGGRLYRTGDLARMRPDGQLEFRGRVDAQVKVRGYRIEPAEVEAALTACGDVRHAAVVARPTATGHELVAYVEPSSAGSDADFVAVLRDRLATRLPVYLVPTAWVVMPALPRTGTDKIDRGALPAPVAAPAAPTAGPRTDAERAVAAIWRDVLGTDRVGRDDDFFALGGHSLLAARVLARLRREFGGGVTLRQVYEHPRLSALAASLPAAAGRAVPALRRATAADLESLLPTRNQEPS